MWPYHDDYFCPFGSFFQFLILILAVWLIVVLCRNCKQPPQQNKDDEAMQILRKRYAAGEINQEEFNQKKKDLGA